MKEVIRTTDPTLISFVTALLKAEGIRAFDLDQHMSTLEGSIGILPRRVMVADDHFAHARIILAANDVELPEIKGD